MNKQTKDLIQGYYTAFNAGDMEAFIELLDLQVVHDLNQGGREVGREAFSQFMQRMNRCYKEQVVDLVVMTDDEGTRAAAEFVVLGEYLVTDQGLPTAKGQKYQLPGAAIFEIRNGKIARITNYYNLQEWLRQVGGG